jgi:hypothetical protein
MAIETVGRVVDGKIVVDDYPLVEGSWVRVIIGDEDDGGPELTPEMEAELDEAIASLDRGEGIPLEQVLAELRALERGPR